MTAPSGFTRRQALAGLAGLGALLAQPGQARAASATAAPLAAFPIYSGEQALQGLYGQHLPPLAQAFEAQAVALVAAARQHCASPGPADGLREAWRRTLLAWQGLSTPALGPVLTRRSQREIDFWPARPALLAKALAKAPRSLDELEPIGTPAKGFPAMDLLLQAPAEPAHCPYLVLLAEAIEAEARALREAFQELASRDWTGDESAARQAFAEWINQWLGGVERLRWTQIEQPLQRARTAGTATAPEFPRQRPDDNRAEWLAQWQALLGQARLRPPQRNQPPRPEQAVVPIEALLIGKGRLALAERWGRSLDAVTAGFAALGARPGERELMALSRTLKAVTTLYQGEVAAALDVPLGFSDADGD